MAQKQAGSTGAPKAKKPRRPARKGGVTAKILERRKLALELAKQGGSYRQIAETLRSQPGISPKYDESQAYRDVQVELERYRTELREAAELIVQKQVQQVRALMVGIWGFATQGDLASIDRVRALMRDERELFGIVAEAASGRAPATEPADDATGQPIREVVIELQYQTPPLPAQAGELLDLPAATVSQP